MSRWGDRAWHPAVAAWRELAPDAPDPESIDVLRRGEKSTTYRLAGAGPGGVPIIAQHARMGKASIERAAYEQILPHLPLTAPRCYGFREESAQLVWLFLEDVGDERYSDADPAHRVLAARWMGRMHTTAARVAAARGLPDGGPPRYLDHLRAGRHAIHANLANPALGAGEAPPLQRLVADLDRLESGWAAIERACAGVPATLVHGDFRPKNAYVRAGANGLDLFAIDWETAGWAVPAVDLIGIDLPTYWSVVQPSWPGVQLEDVRRLAAVGRVLRPLAAIRWVSPELAYDAPACLVRPTTWLRTYHGRLADAVRELEALA